MHDINSGIWIIFMFDPEVAETGIHRFFHFLYSESTQSVSHHEIDITKEQNFTFFSVKIICWIIALEKLSTKEKENSLRSLLKHCGQLKKSKNIRTYNNTVYPKYDKVVKEASHATVSLMYEIKILCIAPVRNLSRQYGTWHVYCTVYEAYTV